MGMNSAPNPRPTMATLILLMLCGRGAQSFDRTDCGFAVEYTDFGAVCQIKKTAHTAAANVTRLTFETRSEPPTERNPSPRPSPHRMVRGNLAPVHWIHAALF